MVSSLRGKIQKSSKNFIAVCIKTMFTLTASHKSLVVFIDVLQELVCAHMESLSFGGKSFDYQKEHEFWMNFIKCNENSNEWQKIVGELVYKRVKKISKLTSLIEAFKSLFKEDEANTVVKVIITAMEESIAASTFNQKDLGTLAHHTSKWSKSLFSRCFDEKYPNPD
ncbi:PREDICTED: uncharacterized protein LOC109583314 [Amphimedon queenslandica]|uniref:Uncharacterized protein n=1 Tax=Amphimedon queenslandica TaxID=400682 RepID=A0AAN0JAZ6_AMPQE|nr:PREDICTED: uncharacterized protein LOC109583314 [Amphimedon queenslandica]|eukprot:XP_019854159.1 PREDICTED: uncharacterized protein LOC109583314 [Amphimedon queenslandica]